MLPADPVRTHAAIEALVGQVVDAGALPIILGGDHSIAEPDIRAIATRRGGPVGLIHFDTHTDTGQEVFGVELSHGSIMYRLVEQGHVGPEALRPDRPARLLAGRDRVRLAARARHHVACSCTTSARSASARWSSARSAIVGDGPVFLSVDVDVLDPAFAPGTGTPEPGGMTSVDLLWACREIGSRVELVRDGRRRGRSRPAVGSADITALVADRIVREVTAWRWAPP